MADMKENNMNDGVPSLDEAAAEAVRLSVGPRPEADGPSRHKGRRTLVIVIAVVVAVALVAGVCGYRAYENHRVSLAREACQQASATQAKAVKDYKALLGSDDTAAALKTDAKTVKDAKTVDALRQAAKAKTPAMVPCDASDVDGLDAATAAASKAEKTVKTRSRMIRPARRWRRPSDEHQQTDQHGVQAPGHVHIVGRAGTCGQTDPRDAQPRPGTPQAAQARGRDAGRDHERTGVLVDRVELSRAGRPLSE